jgi:tripartite-type tricarboxylate transporter receptor subunit TctC
MPEVPTIAEQGLPKYSFDAWFAILGPPGLPKAQVDRIYGAIKTALATKEVQEGLVAQGIEPVASSPETTPAFVESEVTKHVKLSKDAGLKAE